MRMSAVAYVLPAILALAGCSAASDAVDAVDEPRTASLHGTWQSESGVQRPARITVEQRALSARLIVALDGHVCLAESTLEVEVSFDGVKTVADVGGMHLEIEGEPGLEELVGNFAALEDGPCRGQGGWLTVFRR